MVVLSLAEYQHNENLREKQSFFSKLLKKHETDPTKKPITKGNKTEHNRNTTFVIRTLFVVFLQNIILLAGLFLADFLSFCSSDLGGTAWLIIKIILFLFENVKILGFRKFLRSDNALISWSILIIFQIMKVWGIIILLLRVREWIFRETTACEDAEKEISFQNISDLDLSRFRLENSRSFNQELAESGEIEEKININFMQIMMFCQLAMIVQNFFLIILSKLHYKTFNPKNLQTGFLSNLANFCIKFLFVFLGLHSLWRNL